VHDNLDLAKIDLRDPGAQNRVMHALQAHGIAVFAGVSDRVEALRLARRLITITPHRDSDPDGITTIVHRPETALQAGFAGFSDRELHPHTEGSALAQPPGVLILICMRPARAGGHSVLVDGRRLYDDIARDDRGMLAVLSAPRSAYFGGGSGHLASVFEPATDGRITVRFSPVLTRHVDRLRHVVERQARMLRLAEGEGFALLNDRWLHGRTQFTGDRAMLRMLGNLLPVHSLPSGFVPITT
jgi:hypothetical protein